MKVRTLTAILSSALLFSALPLVPLAEDSGLLIIYETEEETEKTAKENVLPDDFPLTFNFSSGVGAWGNSLILYPDGSFEGEYSDWDAIGEVNGVEVNGVYYVCFYSGSFKDIEKTDDHSWSLTLDQLSYDNPLGESWVEDSGNTCVVVEPYGLEEGKQFCLYDPDTPLEELDEDFLNWWPGNYYSGNNYETLSWYGLYNEEMGYGFFASVSEGS